MKQTLWKRFRMTAALLASFFLWTAAVLLVDVQTIGPLGSAVGLAAMNRFVHTLTGVHMAFYTLTDRLSLIPAALVAGFLLLGLCQWIRRKRFLQVDHSLLILGGFYLAVGAVFGLFEVIPVNFRPILIEGVLEASYPSSTTLLVLCVLPTAMLQLRSRISHPVLKGVVLSAAAAFTAFMVMGRVISGVHWFSDIVGGALLSAALVSAYGTAVRLDADRANGEAPV